MTDQPTPKLCKDMSMVNDWDFVGLVLRASTHPQAADALRRFDRLMADYRPAGLMSKAALDEMRRETEAAIRARKSES